MSEEGRGCVSVSSTWGRGGGGVWQGDKRGGIGCVCGREKP